VRLSSPRALKAVLPSTEVTSATVAESRERVIRILQQRDPRLLVVVGPCSIHDEKGALDAFRAALALHPRLKGMAERVRTLTEKVEGRPI